MCRARQEGTLAQIRTRVEVQNWLRAQAPDPDDGGKRQDEDEDSSLRIPRPALGSRLTLDPVRDRRRPDPDEVQTHSVARTAAPTTCVCCAGWPRDAAAPGCPPVAR